MQATTKNLPVPPHRAGSIGKSHRQQAISTLFAYLKPYQYILLKHTDSSLADISIHSDLDILISEEDTQTFVTQLRLDQHIWKCEMVTDNAMSQLFIYYMDRSFLQVDLLHDFRRKELVYLDFQEVMNSVVVNEEGVKVYPKIQLLEHVVLFSFLNYAGVPQKYLNYLRWDEADLLPYFNNKYHTDIKDLSAFAKYNEKLREHLLKTLYLIPQNHGIDGLKNRWTYYKNTLKKVKSNRGRIISFSGVDGAGKSTVLENVKKLLKEKYRRDVVVLRHRPSVLPILSAYKHGKAEAEKRAATTLPRQGGNKNRLSSFVRFGYYFLDYLFGQHYVHVKHIMRGKVLLYDRYYFDFIVDGRRSNIDLGKKMPKFLYRFVRKPHLNFFLYAPADIILERKQELNKEAIEELTTSYTGLFNSLSEKYDSNAYHCVENIELEKTLTFIEDQYLQKI